MASERTSKRSGARERSEYCGASKQMSGASERANGRASGPVLQSVSFGCSGPKWKGRVVKGGIRGQVRLKRRHQDDTC